METTPTTPAASTTELRFYRIEGAGNTGVSISEKCAEKMSAYGFGMATVTSFDGVLSTEFGPTAVTK